MEARHQLAAIVFTDAVGSSQSMREDEDRTLAILHEDLGLMRQLCVNHGGEVLKTTGDGLMLLFKSASQAVLCALDIQQQVGSPEKGALQHRIGIHLGDVFLSDGDAHGDGVNIARRLEEMASPGCICLSKTVLDVAKSRLRVQPKAIGVRQLKGIEEGMEVFEIAPDGKPRKSVATKRSASGIFLPAFGMVLVALVAIAAFVTRPWEPKQDELPNLIVKHPQTPEPAPRTAPGTNSANEIRQAAEDMKRIAAEQKGLHQPADSGKMPGKDATKVTVVPAPKPPDTPSETPGASELDALGDGAVDGGAFVFDSDKFADGMRKTVVEAMKAVPPGLTASMNAHPNLKGYPEQSSASWKSRDFSGMVDWIKKQPWASGAEGRQALRHWTQMADFKDWYLSQLRLYSADKPLSIGGKGGGVAAVTAYMLPSDVIAYQRGKSPLRKVGFENLPMWVIGASYAGLLGDSQEPKKHVFGFTAMQIEQRIQKTSDVAE